MTGPQPHTFLLDPPVLGNDNVGNPQYIGRIAASQLWALGPARWQSVKRKASAFHRKITKISCTIQALTFEISIRYSAHAQVRASPRKSETEAMNKRTGLYEFKDIYFVTKFYQRRPFAINIITALSLLFCKYTWCSEHRVKIQMPVTSCAFGLRSYMEGNKLLGCY